jgi:septal ring factor EnvC (AmiA/AmiB activator)
VLPALASAQNSTSSIENIRDTKLLAMQNQIFELQKSSAAQQLEITNIRKEFATVQKTVATHDRDILRVLDALNTTNSNALELSENLENAIAQIKTRQEKEQTKIGTTLSSLLGEQKELQKKISDLSTSTNQRFKKTTQTISTADSTQTSSIEKIHTEINALKKALAAGQKQVQELETVISSQHKKTLNHLSSIENLNATLAGLQERSQSELQDIHQSLTQVITYGLLTILGVVLLSLIIFLIIRRKHTPGEKDAAQSQSPLPVLEKDDEIMDWLKQKNHEESS